MTKYTFSIHPRALRSKYVSLVGILLVCALLGLNQLVRQRASAHQHLLKRHGGLSGSGPSDSRRNFLPICERTLLVDWGSFISGFGSSYMIVLQAAYFAKQHNYTVLFSRDSNFYGKYLDYYVPATLTCYATEEMYHTDQRQDGSYAREITESFEQVRDGDVALTANYYVSQHHCLAVNALIIEIYLWESFSSFHSLPLLSSQSPLPFHHAMPTNMQLIFQTFSELSYQHFQYNAQIHDQIEWGKSQLARMFEPDDIVIGVHYRGGDKLVVECKPTLAISCGNITLHAEAAYESFLAVAYERDVTGQVPKRKPKMLLLTVEPVLEQFREDPIGSRFDIIEMPVDVRTAKSFDQQDFNQQLPLQERISSTRSMLASLEILVLYLDLAIVSTNSNIGRVAMLRGGVERLAAGVKVRPLDMYFFPTLWKLVYPQCDGNTNCDP